jgi:ABC-type uncharacterized transport system auxiliary subunit
MKIINKHLLFLSTLMVYLFLITCGKVPVKKFYVINYEPEPMRSRQFQGPYPYTIRVKEFTIEEAYARPQLVYRKSPFELEYYYFRAWAVKPVRMVTDAVDKHIASTGIVSHVVRRFDEGEKPDYELSGHIEAIEEYDSENVWFAHLAIRMRLTRMSDGRTLYMRRFDRRKQVFQHDPEYVIRELSHILDFILSQALHDIDVVLGKEFGVTSEPIPERVDTLSGGENSE